MKIEDDHNPEEAQRLDQNYEGRERYRINFETSQDGPQFYSFNSQDMHNRSLFKRTFGAMDKGSVRGSIFTLCSVTVGSGVLALPYVFKSVGFMLGVILLGIATFASAWSQYLIVSAAESARVLDYAHMTRKAGGKRLENFL